jgi:hypothetical protein
MCESGEDYETLEHILWACFRLRAERRQMILELTHLGTPTFVPVRDLVEELSSFKLAANQYCQTGYIKEKIVIFALSTNPTGINKSSKKSTFFHCSGFSTFFCSSPSLQQTCWESGIGMGCVLTAHFSNAADF